MQTITLRLRLHKPTRTKDRLYRELTERTTALANNLVAAGRPKGLTPYLPAVRALCEGEPERHLVSLPVLRLSRAR